jgi:hypothetical protein
MPVPSDDSGSQVSTTGDRFRDGALVHREPFLVLGADLLR